MKHRIVECFLSLQGEGKYVGQPTIFVRYFGCTLNCRGFGMPRGELSYEYDNIVKNELSKYKDDELTKLPLVKTGCDSYVTLAPECMRFCKEYTTEELAQYIYRLIPDEVDVRNYHVCFTGGEPMIHQNIITELMVKLNDNGRGIREFTFETNGTLELNDQNIAILNSNPYINVTFSVSPKLSISGNPTKKAFKPNALVSYNKVKNGYLYYKFVVQNNDDIDEAKDWIKGYSNSGVKYDEIFLMPVGGTACKETDLTAVDVAKLCMKYGFRYSPREHITLFGNRWSA